MQKMFRIVLKEGSSGLVFATSPDHRGFLVALKPDDDMFAMCREAWAALEEAATGQKPKEYPEFDFQAKPVTP